MTVVKYDHKERGLALLPSYWNDKPVAKGLLEAFLVGLNDIEDATEELRNDFTIKYGYGIVLDIIAALYNLKRDGRSDEELRTLILTEGVLLYSDGTADAIIEVVNAYTQRSDCNIIDYENGLAFVQIGGGFTDTITKFLNENASACGVKLQVAVHLGQTMLARSSSPEILTANGDEVEVDSLNGQALLEVNNNNTTWQMPICWII